MLCSHLATVDSSWLPLLLGWPLPPNQSCPRGPADRADIEASSWLPGVRSVLVAVASRLPALASLLPMLSDGETRAPYSRPSPAASTAATSSMVSSQARTQSGCLASGSSYPSTATSTRRFAIRSSSRSRNGAPPSQLAPELTPVSQTCIPSSTMKLKQQSSKFSGLGLSLPSTARRVLRTMCRTCGISSSRRMVLLPVAHLSCASNSVCEATMGPEEAMLNVELRIAIAARATGKCLALLSSSPSSYGCSQICT
mmetsp:Transcript_10861/g.21082  ORF Transcript_10861/g.21082 Transcript_10861/m.21082 type:complete len:255 (-) Transcript_10861:639-1403(-)